MKTIARFTPEYEALKAEYFDWLENIEGAGNALTLSEWARDFKNTEIK